MQMGGPLHVLDIQGAALFEGERHGQVSVGIIGLGFIGTAIRLPGLASQAEDVEIVPQQACVVTEILDAIYRSTATGTTITH
jgi:hypothetical protein